jgi:hypothetical protein
MQHLLARCLCAPLKRAADALTRARLWLANLLYRRFLKTEADGIRTARLRRLVKQSWTIGLLSDEDSDVTLAWRELAEGIAEAGLPTSTAIRQFQDSFIGSVAHGHR